MPKFTQKYTIISLLEDIKEGYEYPSDKWPLHITIADTFAIKWDVNELIEKLVELSKTLLPMSSVALHDENFGPEQQTEVTILDMNKDLTDLHYKVVGILKEAEIKFDDPQYTESGFRAHVTVQPHARINKDDTVTLDNLALVDMFPNGDPYQRKIIKTIKLQGSKL